MTSGIYSQSRLITEIQRDSIYAKIIRGKQALEENKILNLRLVVKDSVIGVQTNIIGIQKIDLGLKDRQITALNTVINNQKIMITNEKKRGRRKGFFGFLKGAGAGAGAVVVLLLML